LLQVRDDVLAGGIGGFVTSPSAHCFHAGQMMPFLPVSHSVRRLAGKGVQPLMHLGIRFAKLLSRFFAMLFKRGHNVCL
jgi:phosphotransferase system IIA component